MNETLFELDDADKYFTPPEIIKFLVGLTNPQQDEKALGIGFNPDIVVNEIKKKTGSNPVHIKSEINPALLPEIDEKKFDIIVCGPLFGFRIQKEISETNEEFWLKWGLDHLHENGRLAIIMPMGFLTNYKQQGIRETVLNDFQIEKIIQIPSGWSLGSMISSGILLISNLDPDPNFNVMMLHLADAKSLIWDEILAELQQEKPNFSNIELVKYFSKKNSEITGERLDAAYYDPVYKPISNPNPEIYQEYDLGELVEIRSGERLSKDKIVNDGIPFIQVGNINFKGEISLRSANYIDRNVAKAGRGYCVNNDIIISTSGTIGKIALVDDALVTDGVSIATSLRRLRVIDQSIVLSEYLSIYLRSEHVQLQLKRSTSGSAIPILNSPRLSKIKIFLPDLDEQLRRVDLYHDLRSSFKEILLSVFPELEKAQNVIQQVSSNAIKDGTQLPLDLDHYQEPSLEEIVQNDFPYLIAQPYTILCDKNRTPEKRFKDLIRLSEAIVYFAHSILAADCFHNQIQITDELRYQLKASLLDYSIEKRINFILTILKIKQQNQEWEFFVPELLGVNFGICKEIHRKLRNVDAHSNQSDAWYESQIMQYEEKINQLLGDLLPIRFYKLMRITSLTKQDGQYHHLIESFMGNNSTFSSQKVELDYDLDVDTNHISLLDKDNNILDLHPFYLIHAWREVGMNENLCYLKIVKGEHPNYKLRVESSFVFGETEIDDSTISKLFANKLDK